MQIVNVIELTQGNLQSVTSWIVKSDEDKDKQAKLAEAHYISCVRENIEHESDKNLSDEDILDTDSYTNGSGYEVQIVWSHTVNE